MLEKRDSNIIKAIAITLVILSHLSTMLPAIDDYTRNLPATGGVCLFLFLSGYGTYLSYAKNGMHRGFWENKFDRIFLPYWIVTLLFVLLMRRDLSASNLASNFLFIDFARNIDGSMWYMSFIVLMYALTFLIFFAKTNDLIKILLLGVACFCIRGIALEGTFFDKCSWQFTQNSFSYPLGMLFAWMSTTQVAQKWASVLRPTTVKIFFLLFGIAGYTTVTLLFRGSLEYFQIHGIFLCMIIFSLVSLIRPLLPELLVRGLNRAGEASYTAYLVEMKLLIIVAAILPSGTAIGKLALFVVLLAVSTITFELLWHFLRKLTRKNDPKSAPKPV